MKSTTKKNLLAVLLMAASVALLVMGIFAFFSDRGDADVRGIAGTVNVEVGDINGDGSDLININPGDHDWRLAEYLGYADWADAGTSITAGSEHEIALEIANQGNKSVKIRNTIDLIVDLAFDNVTVGEDFMFFLTAEGDRTATGAAELAEKYYLLDLDGPGSAPYTVVKFFAVGGDFTAEGYYEVDASGVAVDPTAGPVATTLATCVGVRYIVFDPNPANGYILKGVGTAAEAPEEDPAIDGTISTKDFTYYLGLRADADNRYQGAELQIDWHVEAVQHRNTDSANVWAKVAEKHAQVLVPAHDEDAEGTKLVP